MAVLDEVLGTDSWQVGQQGGRVRLAIWADSQGSALLATAGSDGGLAVWTLNPDGTSTACRPLQGHEAAIYSVTFWAGPQGLRLISAGTGSDVRVWNPMDGSLLDRIPTGGSSTRSALCWSGRDGHRLAIGGYDGTVRVVDLETGETTFDPAAGHTAPVNSLHAWETADGAFRLVSGADNGVIIVWDPETGTPAGPQFVRPGARAIHAMTSWTRQDGTRLLASGTGDGAVDLWDAAGTFVASRRTHATSVLVLGSWRLPDGEVVLCSGDSAGTLQIRHAETGEPVQPTDSLQATGTLSTGGLAVWSQSNGVGRLAVSGTDGTVRIWDVASASIVHDLRTPHVAAIWSLACWQDADGSAYVASAGTGGVIRVWDVDTGRMVDDSMRHEPGIWVLRTAADQQGRIHLISGGLDGDIRVWDMQQRQPAFAAIDAHAASVSDLASWTDPDGHLRLASVGDDSLVGLWDPEASGALTGAFAGHEGGLLGMTHWRTKDGHDRLATGGADNLIRLWDPATATVLGEINAEGGRGTWSLCAWATADGRPHLGSSHAGGAIRIWEPEQGRLIRELTAGGTDHTVKLAVCRWSDGRVFLASAGRAGVIELWDPETGKRLGTPLQGHRGGIRAVASMPRIDGSVWLVSAGDDGTIRLWDPLRGVAVRTVELGPLRTWGFSDAPADRDVLGRQVLIDQIVEQLRPDPDGKEQRPLVLTVEGPWGSGKTTLMALVQRGLSAVSEQQRTSPKPVGHLTVREAVRLLRRYPEEGQHLAEVPCGQPRFVVSAWFNPWAHQSGEQIWAGLTEAIMGAVEPVLYPTAAHRERYWFLRNLSRVDRHVIRNTLLRRVTSPLLGVALLAATVPIAVAAAQRWQGQRFLDLPVNAATIALLIPVGLLVAGCLHTAIRHRWGWAVKYLPSAMFAGPVATTGDGIGIGSDSGRTPYVDPLRQAARGSLYLYQHDVNAMIVDLQRADTELVVFIDDLDRCRPSTTAEVIEAINLFLSGVDAEALRARFVVGMDPTVVVAHLDHIYSTLGRQHVGMSNDDSSPGWAFLRKLVQLPIAVSRIQDSAVDEFIRVALAMPPATVPSVQVAPATTLTNAVSRLPARPFTNSASSRPRPTTISPKVDVIPWRSIEQHPSIHSFLTERINAQPDRSVREIKRVINVWQFYHRVVTLVRPAEDTAATIRQALALILLSEIITRWPALQPNLRARREGRSGLHHLVVNAHDDEGWSASLAAFQLNEGFHGLALQSLRELLVRYDCGLAADLADFLL